MSFLFEGRPRIGRWTPCVGCLIVVIALGLVAALAPGDAALAAPESIEQAQEDAAALRSQIDSLGEELSVAVEEYNYAQYRLEETNQRITENRSRLEKAESDLAAASARLQERVRGIYMDGVLDFAEVLFSARSFTDLVNRWEMLARVGERDGEVVKEVSSFRQEKEEAAQALAEQSRNREALLAEAESAKARVEDSLAERKRLLEDKKDEIAALEEEERKRQERLERERAAREAEAARKAEEEARQAAAAQENSGQSTQASGTTAVVDGGSSEAAGDVPPSEVGDGVVEVAMQYRGVPYVWAGASPAGFDCSGLVQYSFGQLGVYLPHSSRAQFGYGSPVSRENLLPGDLVFFGSPIHHVGIYVGNGSMIHAPYTGVNVRVDSMNRSDYVGARRING